MFKLWTWNICVRQTLASSKHTTSNGTQLSLKKSVGEEYYLSKGRTGPRDGEYRSAYAND